MRKVLILAAICAVAVLGATPARAACLSPTPVANLGAPLSPIVGCPDGKPVAAFAYQLSNPAGHNSGPNDIVCEQFGGTCGLDPADTASNNGIVNVQTDWANVGFVGCPTPNRIVISLQCNDGSGALISIGNCPNFGGYNVEMAFPFDANTSAALPLDVSPSATTNGIQNNGRPTIMSFNRTGGMDQAMVNVPVPVMKTDCDEGSLGEALQAAGFCDLGCPFAPSLSRGGLYTSTQPCTDTDPRPGIRARAQWTPVALDAAGNATINMPTPSAGNCNFIGSSANTGGGETPDIVGFVVLGGPTAASPVAEAVRAVRKGGSVEVSFRTSSELSLAGFNIYAAGKAKGGEIKLNAGLVSATGVGGAGSSYSLSYALGSLKGNRGIIVESVMTDGSTLRASLVEF